MKRALFIGRFQPFHWGHFEDVMLALKECDEVIIAIGSTKLGLMPDNPFTAGERYEMIYQALDCAPDPLDGNKWASSRCHIIPVPDINYFPVWVRHVEVTCPEFHRVYSGNEYVLRLFREAGYEVCHVEKYGSDVTGTEIRRLIVENGDWQSKTLVEVAEHICKIDGVARLQAITRYGGRGK